MVLFQFKIVVISCYASKLNTETGSPARPTIIVEKLTVKLDAQQLTHSQETTPCRFPTINGAMVTSLIEGGELFWGRETARCGVQSCLGRDFCELIYAVDED